MARGGHQNRQADQGRLCGGGRRRLVKRLVAVGTGAVVACALVVVATRSTAGAVPVSFAPGSLIIPMDADTSANHARLQPEPRHVEGATASSTSCFENGIPVLLGDQATSKTRRSRDVDFTVRRVTGQAHRTRRSARGTIAAGRSSSTAPTPPRRCRSSPPGGRRTATSRTCTRRARGSAPTCDVTLRSAPRIANEAINAGISIAYYNAAGIPDSNGNPWSRHLVRTSSTRRRSPTAALFDAGHAPACSGKFDIFVTPHNGGYSYSLTDPTEPRHEDVRAARIRSCSRAGGWTALCATRSSSNENNIADLTPQRQPGRQERCSRRRSCGRPAGGFLTTNGFPVIDEHRRDVDDATPTGRPAGRAGQRHVTSPRRCRAARCRPGRRPGPGAPTYWPNTERVGLLRRAGGQSRQHHRRHVPRRHRRGKLTYIGGHSFSTSLPYAAQRRGAVPAGVLQLAVLQRRRRREARPDPLAEHVPAERHGAAEREHRQHGRQRRDQRHAASASRSRPASATSRRRPGRLRSSTGRR